MKQWSAMAAAVGLACSAQPASALQIVMVDKGGIAGTPAEAAFNIAAGYWASVLTNDVTLHLDVSFENLGSGILGVASPAFADLPASYFYQRLVATQTSELDASAVASLSEYASSNTIVRVTSANLRAIFPRAFPASNDATIRFNTLFRWDYDPSD